MQKSIIESRAVFLEAVRDFFKSRQYIEVMTPHLVPTPGTEVHLRYFETKWTDHQRKDHQLYLRSSPELHMKKVLSQGVSRAYQIAACFRNVGEMSAWHRPEFLMLEFYRAGMTPEAFIAETFEFMKFTAERLKSSFKMPKSYETISVYESFKRFAGIELQDEDANLAKKAIAKGILSVQPNDDFETAFFKVLLEKIEPEIAKIPIAVLCDYPPSQAALARVEQGVARRFEFYVHGVELSNGFYELLDVEKNIERFESANKRRQAFGYETPALDQSFIAALKRGLPECCGNALGLDRWFAILLGNQDLSALDQDIFDGF